MLKHFSSPYIARYEAICTGLGFTLGFGWLWFPYLQEFWLPNFLWGSPFGGGGSSIFVMLLLAAFFGVGALSRKLALSLPEHLIKNFRTNRLPGITHGASLAFMALAFLPNWGSTGFLAYLPVALMAFAASCQGVFWSGAIFSLSPRQAGEAFLVASVTAFIICLAMQLLPQGMRNAGLFFVVGAAWVAAKLLGFFLRIPAENNRRSRGRPPKPKEKTHNTAHEGQMPGWQVVLAVFALLVMGEVSADQSSAFAPWFAALLAAFGAAAGMALCACGRCSFWGCDNGWKPYALAKSVFICLASAQVTQPSKRFFGLVLLLFGLGLILFPAGGVWIPGLIYFVQGLFSLLALLALVWPPCAQVNLKTPLSNAALALGMVLAVTTGGSGLWALAGSLFRAATAHMTQTLVFFSWLTPARITGIFILAASLALFARLQRRPAPGQYAASGMVLDKSACPHGLTKRESEIIRCLSQGMSDAQIADFFHIKQVTVRYHIANLFRKTGYKTRERLASSHRVG